MSRRPRPVPSAVRYLREDDRCFVLIQIVIFWRSKLSNNFVKTHIATTGIVFFKGNI